MGFMDKLKNAGKGVLKGALTMAATPYGMVSAGKHQLCKVCMNGEHDKLVFVKVAAVEAEYEIKKDIKTFYVFLEDDMKGSHQIKLEFNNGENCVVMLTADKNQGSALPSAQERIAAQYRNIGKLVKALAKQVPEISDETKKWVNKIMHYCGNSNLF